MADQNNRGFRKFMLDPKSSVMTYIADNIPPEHMPHHQGSSGRLQGGPMNSQQSSLQDPNRLQQNQILSQTPQNQSQDDFMRPPLPTRPSQSNSQSASLRPGYAQPVQNPQMPTNTPYLASNVSQANQGLNGYAGAQSQLPGSQSMSDLSMAQETMSQQGPQSQFLSVQNGTPSTATLGQGPPQPGARRRNSPQSAPRLYHRMMLEFEITKNAFFLAKSQRDTQEMTSTAYELESSSRRIWGLRYEHSWEFEGYSEAGHQAVFSKWQAEYEMWADTVLDIQDGQVLADAATPSKFGNSSMRRDGEEWDSQSRQARSGFQELNGENEHHGQSIREEQMPPQMPQQMPHPSQQQILSQQPMPHQQQMPPQQQMHPQQQQFPPPQQMPQQQQMSPQQQQLPPPQQQTPQQQQMPQLQNLSVGQSTPPPQHTQTSHPPQQMPPPGSFPQSAPPPPTINDQILPPQQRQQSPQPPQMQMAQSPPPNLQSGQNVQHGQFDASPGVQNGAAGPGQHTQLEPNTSGPYVQQPQNIRPGQTPGIMQQSQNRPTQQQYMQQQQQNMGPGQQGPQRNGMPQGQNMGPRQNPSPRPGSQVPPSLQPGGQMMGGARQ